MSGNYEKILACIHKCRQVESTRGGGLANVPSVCSEMLLEYAT